MRSSLIVATSVVVGIGLPLLGGCSAFDHLTRTCTLRPCGATLYVDFGGAPTTSVRVEATDVSTNERRVFECSTNCGANAWFMDFTPEQVILRVTTPAGTVEQTVRPSYQQVRPNGRGCEPVCPEAHVTMSLPA
jgi:hypothetical protein